MKKPKKIFSKRQREFMVWICQQQMHFQTTGEAQAFRIEDIMQQFNLKHDDVVAAMMFLQATSVVVPHA